MATQRSGGWTNYTDGKTRGTSKIYDAVELAPNRQAPGLQASVEQDPGGRLPRANRALHGADLSAGRFHLRFLKELPFTLRGEERDARSAGPVRT